MTKDGGCISRYRKRDIFQIFTRFNLDFKDNIRIWGYLKKVIDKRNDITEIKKEVLHELNTSLKMKVEELEGKLVAMFFIGSDYYQKVRSHRWRKHSIHFQAKRFGYIFIRKFWTSIVALLEHSTGVW